MKGSGWAVKRYFCPVCDRKGLYYSQGHTENYFICMYLNCKSNTEHITIDQRDVQAANPELLTQKPQFKP